MQPDRVLAQAETLCGAQSCWYVRPHKEELAKLWTGFMISALVVSTVWPWTSVEPSQQWPLVVLIWSLRGTITWITLNISMAFIVLIQFYITSFVLSLARAWARWALKVLFPTPPFPDSTRILCLTVDSFSPISAMAADETGGGHTTNFYRPYCMECIYLSYYQVLWQSYQGRGSW